MMNETPLEKAEDVVEEIETAAISDDSSWNKHSNLRSFIVLAVVGVLVGWFYMGVNSAPGTFPANEIVTIPDGSNLTTAAKVLEEKHIVRSAWWLSTIIKIRGKANHVYAGDYVFKQPLTVLEVAQRVTSGAFGLEPVKIFVPEGATVKQIAKQLDTQLIHFNKELFIEEGEKEEGYLFPDTYFVLPNIKEADMIKLMKETFYKKIDPYKDDIATSKYSLTEILTIASILEKEESDKKDRKMIAGIINNRLAKKMPLQVDATFLYILGKGTFGLSREDLKHQSPYNTYVHAGLPPGPINNPGLDSIEAVLHPTDNPYIFYLADAHGTTYYSKTYAEHLEKKRQYIDPQYTTQH
jgi:UPF0755 protein